MSNVKKLMMTAAGGGEAINVEDVFSIYNYEGSGSTGYDKPITNGIALGDFGVGSSTRFGGENGDYLGRTSDFTNNSDSKTFTFSGWIYRENSDSNMYIYSADDGTYHFNIYVNSSNNMVISGWANTSSRSLYAQSSGLNMPWGWVHVLISIDLTNTSRRYIFLNDVNETNHFSFNTYTNQNIKFTWAKHSIGAFPLNGGEVDGNLAHIYLDYTYRDLTTTSNRRIFIDSNGGSTSPSSLSALNPIMYIPCTEDYALGKNLGTGGDLSVNGTVSIDSRKGTVNEVGYGQGGLVWIKNREYGYSHTLSDTVRGTASDLRTDSNGAEQSSSQRIVKFNANGFSIGYDNAVNYSPSNICSWTFRKAPKFFDIIEYTGNGSSQTISHNLGSNVGSIWIKKTSGASNWWVWHRGIATTTNGLYLNAINGEVTGPTNQYFYVKDVTSSSFKVGEQGTVNGSNETYIAYVFAHNDGDGGFGTNGDLDIIKCGYYTGTGQENPGVVVDLGFEPQWLLIKSLGDDDWVLMDTERGFESNTFRTKELFYINSAGTEFVDDLVHLKNTGFRVYNNSSKVNTLNRRYIYMAIRRGNTGVPTKGTDVFSVVNVLAKQFLDGFKVHHHLYNPDMLIETQRDASEMQQKVLIQRKHGENYISRTNFDTLRSNIGLTYTTKFREHSAYLKDALMYPQYSVGNNDEIIYWIWKRAQGYFDILEYVGDGSNGQRIDHYLGAVPAMMWIKNESGNNAWAIWHKELNGGVNAEDYYLGFDQQFPANTETIFGKHNSFYPTDTQFEVGSSARTNSNGNVYNAYLFGEVEGVTKMGSYSGNGSTQNIDCGFTNGARFVLIKAVSGDGAAAWLTFDTARGIVSGNDPVLKLHDGNAEVSNKDPIDPLSSGFTINQETTFNANKSGSTYIYYAIA